MMRVSSVMAIGTEYPMTLFLLYLFAVLIWNKSMKGYDWKSIGLSIMSLLPGSEIYYGGCGVDADDGHEAECREDAVLQQES